MPGTRQTAAAWLNKWKILFADNEYQNITEATFRDKDADIAATFVDWDHLGFAGLGDSPRDNAQLAQELDAVGASLSDLTALLDTKENTAKKNVANGYLGLNSAGLIDIARLPVLPAGRRITSAGGIAAITTAQQAQIGQGTIVTTTDGFRWCYAGYGSKTDQASYIQLADITPEWAVIANKPAWLSSGSTSDLAEGTNLFFTAARVLGTVLTGYVKDTVQAAVGATSTLLQWLQQMEYRIGLKAPLASPTFTGTPSAPTAATGTATAQVATTSFVQQEKGARKVYAIINSQSGPSGFWAYFDGSYGGLVGLNTTGALVRVGIPSDAFMADAGIPAPIGLFYYARQGNATSPVSVVPVQFLTGYALPAILYRNTSGTTGKPYETLRVEKIAADTWLVTPAEGEATPVQQRTGTTVLDFTVDADFAEIASGTFTYTTVGKAAGVVVTAFLAAGCTAITLPSADFEQLGNTTFTAGAAHTYMFLCRVGVNAKIQYTLNKRT